MPDTSRRGETEEPRRGRRDVAYAIVGASAILAAVVVLVLSVGGSGRGKPSAPGQVQASGPPRTSLLATGEKVPSFSAPALGGGRVDWSEYAGTPVVLALWAPWCPHCQNELPVLDRVAERFPDVELVTIATSIGKQTGPSPAEFMKDHGLAFPVAIDDADGTLARAFGLQYFPTIYFVKSDGTVMQAQEGEIPEATLQALFGSLA